MRKVLFALIAALFLSKRRLICFTVLVLLLLSSCGITSCDDSTAQKDVAKAVGLALSGEVVTFYDDHGGFHGDGDTYAEIKLDDNSTFLEEVEAAPGWHPLPMGETVDALVYGVTYTEGDMTVGLGPFVGNDNIPPAPQVSNGYYYFYDRHTESEDPYDESGVLDRYSQNFTAALYDADTDTLYYWAVDT